MYEWPISTCAVKPVLTSHHTKNLLKMYVNVKDKTIKNFKGNVGKNLHDTKKDKNLLCIMI